MFGVGAGAGVSRIRIRIRIVNVEIKALAPLGLFEQDPDRVSCLATATTSPSGQALSRADSSSSRRVCPQRGHLLPGPELARCSGPDRLQPGGPPAAFF